MYAFVFKYNDHLKKNFFMTCSSVCFLRLARKLFNNFYVAHILIY